MKKKRGVYKMHTVPQESGLVYPDLNVKTSTVQLNVQHLYEVLPDEYLNEMIWCTCISFLNEFLYCK